MSTQAENLERVSTRIAPIIIRFARERGLREFYASELHDYVDEAIGAKIAPASADRILRALRLEGTLNYVVLSRSNSLYEFVPSVAVRVSEPEDVP